MRATLHPFADVEQPQRQQLQLEPQGQDDHHYELRRQSRQIILAGPQHPPRQPEHIIEPPQWNSETMRMMQFEFAQSEVLNWNTFSNKRFHNEGGFGVVYRCECVSLQRVVALKKPNQSDDAEDIEAMTQIIREVRTLTLFSIVLIR